MQEAFEYNQRTDSTRRYGNASPSYPPSPPPEDEMPSTYEGQQQQFLYENQNHLLDGVGRTVSTLKHQAGLMGEEVFNQVGMLEDLESGVENSQNRLDRANKNLNKFIQQNKSEPFRFFILIEIIY